MKNTKLIATLSFILIVVCISLLFLNNKASISRIDENKQKYNAKSAPLNNKQKNSLDQIEIKMSKASLKLCYEGNNLNVSLPIYLERNRYYLPLAEVINKINGTALTKDDFTYIKFNNMSFELDEKNNTFNSSNNIHKLKRKLIFIESITYISFFDFTNMFDLKPYFDYDKNVIMLFNNQVKLPIIKTANTNKIALLRLEDLTVGKTYRYYDEESKYKLRIIADYLYSKNIPFHVAWVPRYIDATNGNNIDNDLININNMNNADFLYTLDYFINKGGIIGLHGYTHQAANCKSIDSNEFGNTKDKETFTDEFAIKRIDMGKETAKKLNIPISFFEAPHYSAASNQLKVMEKNFDYIYEPYVASGPNESTSIIIKRNRKRVTKYIPTPLNYLDGKNDLPNMFNKINNLKPEVMASFFFHPNIEFADIKITNDSKGHIAYTYSEKSALHQIINMLESKGYSFKIINKL